MNPQQSTRAVKALGLCSGGLDSMLAALVLKDQGIAVTWISFETPFFSAGAARKAAVQTGIPLVVQDITADYMEMMKAPKAGFGKNMNPCMDCHALMFAKAGLYMEKHGYDFLFSGEVMGQRPKSQTKNALRYVEKNSGFDGRVLRPLSAKCLPETQMEREGLVDRERLMDITGRSRKRQMALAEQFEIKEYPSPAGGCLLTDKGFSNRLRDLLEVQKTNDTNQLHLLKYGRHFRLNQTAKLVVGRSRNDNQQIMKYLDRQKEAHLRHADLPGPVALLSGEITPRVIQQAAELTAAYTTKSKPGEKADIRVIRDREESLATVTTPNASDFRDMMI